MIKQYSKLHKKDNKSAKKTQKHTTSIFKTTFTKKWKVFCLFKKQ